MIEIETDMATYLSVCLYLYQSLIKPTQTCATLFTCSRHTNRSVLRHPIPFQQQQNYIRHIRLNPRVRLEGVDTDAVRNTV